MKNALHDNLYWFNVTYFGQNLFTAETNRKHGIGDQVVTGKQSSQFWFKLWTSQLHRMKPLGREHVLIMYTVWHSLLEVSLITSNCCCVVSSLNFIIFISWFRRRVSSPFYTVWFFIMNRVYPKWQRQKKTFVFSVNFNHNWKRRTMYCMNCS